MSAPLLLFKSFKLKADSETDANGVKTVYYVVDDTVPANNVAYDYYALLSVNGCLEAGPITAKLNASSPAKVDAITTLNVNAVALDEDGITNDIIVTVKPATGTKIVAISYGVVDSASNVLDSAYANTIPVVTKLADQKQTYLIGKNIEPHRQRQTRHDRHCQFLHFSPFDRLKISIPLMMPNSSVTVILPFSGRTSLKTWTPAAQRPTSRTVS